MRLSASIPGAPHTSSGAGARGVRVTTASESAVRDLAAIAAGTPAFTLMLQAGTRAAEVIVRGYSHRLAAGVLVYAGSGNNGGDAYVVAAHLARMGVRVLVVAAKPPRTPDAIRAAALFDTLAQQSGGRSRTSLCDGSGNGVSLDDSLPYEMWRRAAEYYPQLVIDGLLGTGHEGALRGTVLQCATDIAGHRARGATVISLDIPSGVSATTGVRATGSVCAHTTVTFGTIKRGLLIDRSAAGHIVVVDIGLGHHADGADAAWHYATPANLRDIVAPDLWSAHKGQRGHLALVGGATGMAGAVILAVRAALHAGVGLARAYVDAPGMPAVQRSAPQAIATTWGQLLSEHQEPVWGSALALGPGLGRSTQSRAVLEFALSRFRSLPAVIDADALTLLAQSPVAGIGAEREMVLTPHAGEFARLRGAPTPTSWESRADAVCAFAAHTGATIVLKGTPTLVAAPNGQPPTVVPRGTAVLATGGSGDMLTGIIGTLLAQGIPAEQAAIVGATVHGIAAEHATEHNNGVRGVTLDDVLEHMPNAWRSVAQPATFPPGVVVNLPFAQGTL